MGNRLKLRFLSTKVGPMKIHVISLALFTAASFLGNHALAQKSVPVVSAAEPVNYQDAKAWINEAHGCENIKTFNRPNVIRFTIEAVLACQALKLGGYEGDFQLLEVPNNTRAREFAATGGATMPTETVWADIIDSSKFYASEPIFKDGDLVFGMFVRADKLKTYNVKTLEDLKKLKPVTQPNWVRDWAVLTGMGFNPERASTLESIYLMIGGERADFTLWSFNTLPSFEITVEGITLAPLPGIKVYMHGERKFVISKRAPNAEEIFAALNRGINILRKNGTIARAWRESGYINKRVESWVALN